MPANTVAVAAVAALAAVMISGYGPNAKAHAIAVSPERFCLALAIYFEARGEPRTGQWAVGRVILNRSRLKQYPKTICEVVYQNAELMNRCQFSFACDGKPNWIKDGRQWGEILNDASDLLNCGGDCDEAAFPEGPLALSTHYHSNSVKPSWAHLLHRTGQVGKHIFYRA